METLSLGNTPLSVSSVALGTWTFASDAIWGASEESQAQRVIHAALDQGVTLFDTAPNYGDGHSERILGDALTGRPAAIVATKFKVDGKTPADLREMVIASLRRLRRETIDLMQIHWPPPTSAETFAALEALFHMRDEGLIRELGVCNFGLFDLEETRDFAIASNQIPYNLLWRSVEDDDRTGAPGIATRSRNLGRRTIAYSVLQQGLLTGKYSNIAVFPEGRRRTLHYLAPGRGDFAAETQLALTELLELATRLGRPLGELALAYVGGSEQIDITLIGARTEAQLTESLRQAQATLSLEERAALVTATAPLRRALGGHTDMYNSKSRVRFPGTDGTPVRSILPA